ncbi:MAG: exodeoxyribonuclease VII large subunit [Chthoniobacterales bacterium]
MQLDLGIGETDADAPRILSVTELTRQVRETLEGRFAEIWVRGEISNYRRQASGHHYFTLKDDGSQLPCVLFAGAARALRGLRMADGMQVQAFGEITVYEARGQYQLVVRLVQEEGIGALQARFEALKAKLAAEGLFDAARKRALPKFPARIGVVTSPTGAAIRDFLKVIHRRMPGVGVIINPVRVQGRGAAAEIAAAVAEFSRIEPRVDLVVVTRGGGSLEDLWEFNEEAVARAIVASEIPVVSAVGHEIDFTLSDFAADFRAPTPSAAAELIVPDAGELLAGVAQRVMRMLRECAGAIRHQRTRLAGHERSALFREPIRILRERSQHADALEAAMHRAVALEFKGLRERLEHAARVISAHRPAPRIAMLRDRLLRAGTLLHGTATRAVAKQREGLCALENLLHTLSPAATLARGYSITLDARGGIVKSVEQLAAGDAMRTRLADGEADSVVSGTRRS